MDFCWGERTYVMGIVNATPDSFSGDGLWPDVDALVRRGHLMVQAGADIIDVGGESTRPGAQPVPADEELERVVPVVAALASAGVFVSVDTMKAVVAEAALTAGARMVNDVSGLTFDPDMASVVARYGAYLVLMHNRRARAVQGPLGGYYAHVPYRDVVQEVVAGLEQAVRKATEAGVSPSRLLVDPGLGFGKTPAQSLEIMHRLGELRRLGLPVLVGPSRKSFIGHVLGAPVEERLAGTIAASVLAVAAGADVVRVHDVDVLVQAIRVADAIVRPPLARRSRPLALGPRGPRPPRKKTQ